MVDSESDEILTCTEDYLRLIHDHHINVVRH